MCVQMCVALTGGDAMPPVSFLMRWSVRSTVLCGFLRSPLRYGNLCSSTCSFCVCHFVRNCSSRCVLRKWWLSRIIFTVRWLAVTRKTPACFASYVFSGSFLDLFCIPIRQTLGCFLLIRPDPTEILCLLQGGRAFSRLVKPIGGSSE